jgi:hypothetical protein
MVFNVFQGNKANNMKTIIFLFLMASFTVKVSGQANKMPIPVENARSIFNTVPDLYADYTDQGSRMYINNPHFYQKDNFFRNAVPTGNGFYVQPGNSNPINQELYQGVPEPSGTIFSGYIPIRTYGGTSTNSSGYSR